jgi:hypothetical protein
MGVLYGVLSDNVSSLRQKLDTQNNRRESRVDVVAGTSDASRPHFARMSAMLSQLHCTAPRVGGPFASYTEVRSDPFAELALLCGTAPKAFPYPTNGLRTRAGSHPRAAKRAQALARE